MDEQIMDIINLLSNLHWDVLLKIVGVDLILGLDNAIIIALACAVLAPELRNKAIVIGTAGAILARILFLFIGFWLVGLPFVKFLAGGYLVYLAYSMLVSNNDEHNITAKPTVIGAATTILMADLLMSLDNVVALVGASEGTGSHAFGYTVFGILFSIPIIVFASKGLISIIDKFPVIIWLGSALIAYVGVEMLLKEPFITTHIQEGSLTNCIIAGTTVAVVMLLAFFKTRKKDVALTA